MSLNNSTSSWDDVVLGRERVQAGPGAPKHQNDTYDSCFETYYQSLESTALYIFCSTICLVYFCCTIQNGQRKWFILSKCHCWLGGTRNRIPPRLSHRSPKGTRMTQWHKNIYKISKQKYLTPSNSASRLLFKPCMSSNSAIHSDDAIRKPGSGGFDCGQWILLEFLQRALSLGFRTLFFRSCFAPFRHCFGHFFTVGVWMIHAQCWCIA